MTRLIKVQTDRDVASIVSSDSFFDSTGNSKLRIDDIHVFKSAQRVFMGQLIETELDRLKGSLAPINGDDVIPSTRITGFIASVEFWERLMELQPTIQKIKKSWKAKYGKHIWTSEEFKNKTVTLTKIKPDIIDFVPNKPLHPTEDEITKRDTTGNVTGVIGGLITEDTVMGAKSETPTPTPTPAPAPAPEPAPEPESTGTIPEGFTEYKLYYYGKTSPDNKAYTVLSPSGESVIIPKALTSAVNVKKFIREYIAKS